MMIFSGPEVIRARGLSGRAGSGTWKRISLSCLRWLMVLRTFLSPHRRWRWESSLLWRNQQKYGARRASTQAVG